MSAALKVMGWVSVLVVYAVGILAGNLVMVANGIPLDEADMICAAVAFFLIAKLLCIAFVVCVDIERSRLWHYAVSDEHHCELWGA